MVQSLLLKEIPETRQGRYDLKGPFQTAKYRLVLCDGSNNDQHLENQRLDPDQEKHSERLRLMAAQLILSLNRVESEGTLVILLFIIKDPDIVRLLRLFSRFSDMNIFKPMKAF